MMPKPLNSPRQQKKRLYVKLLPLVTAVSSLLILALGLSVLIFPFNVELSVDLIHEGIVKSSTKSCQILPPDKGPIPVILMSLGRSGSSVTWDTIARFTGDANVAYEVTGGNRTKSMRFFNNINPNLGSYWPIERLCQIQERVISQTTHSGIAGFQWKPFSGVFEHKYSIGALKEIAKHRNPHILVIFLTRNPIDRLISNQRHKGHIRTKEVPHHCKVGDVECLQKHKNHSKDIIIPTGDELISHIGGALFHDNYVKETLANIGVKHLKVSYDALYNLDTAAEWMKIFRFLKRGPTENLTMNMVREKFSMLSTSSKTHEDTISNYEEVKNTLKGTHYYHLLH